jgi:hypothetical protein
MSFVPPEIIYFGLFSGAMMLLNYDNNNDDNDDNSDDDTCDTDDLLNHKYMSETISNSSKINNDSFLETDIDIDSSYSTMLSKSTVITRSLSLSSSPKSNNNDFRIFNDTDPFDSTCQSSYNSSNDDNNSKSKSMQESSDDIIITIDSNIEELSTISNDNLSHKTNFELSSQLSEKTNNLLIFNDNYIKPKSKFKPKFKPKSKSKSKPKSKSKNKMKKIIDETIYKQVILDNVKDSNICDNFTDDTSFDFSNNICDDDNNSVNSITITSMDDNCMDEIKNVINKNCDKYIRDEDIKIKKKNNNYHKSKIIIEKNATAKNIGNTYNIYLCHNNKKCQENCTSNETTINETTVNETTINDEINQILLLNSRIDNMSNQLETQIFSLDTKMVDMFDEMMNTVNNTTIDETTINDDITLPTLNSIIVNDTVRPILSSIIVDDTTQPVLDDSNDTTQPVLDDSNDTTQPVLDDSNDTTQPVIDSSKDTTQPVLDDSNDTTQPVLDDSNDTTIDNVNNSLTRNNILFNEGVRTIRFNEDQVVEVVMTGGGGAGGIGTYDPNRNMCLAYGGGGCAGETICRMINVKGGEEWTMTVGTGGIGSEDIDGSETKIVSMYDGEKKFELVANGGVNGNPKMEVIETIINSNPDDNVDLTQDGITDGGRMDGCDCDPKCNSMCGNGEDGGIGLPSIVASAGDGGSTLFTGIGGSAGNSDDPIGTDGVLGSGGGGSIPFITDMNSDQLSGNGGDGFIRINMFDDNDSMNNSFDILNC